MKFKKGFAHPFSLLAVVVVVAIAGAYLLVQSRAGRPTITAAGNVVVQVTPNADINSVYFAEINKDTGQEVRRLSWIPRTETNSVAFSRDGTRVAYANPSDKCSLYTANLDGSNRQKVPISLTQITDLAWNSTGTSLIVENVSNWNPSTPYNVCDARQGGGWYQQTLSLVTLGRRPAATSIITSSQSQTSRGTETKNTITGFTFGPSGSVVYSTNDFADGTNPANGFKIGEEYQSSAISQYIPKSKTTTTLLSTPEALAYSENDTPWTVVGKSWETQRVLIKKQRFSVYGYSDYFQYDLSSKQQTKLNNWSQKYITLSAFQSPAAENDYAFLSAIPPTPSNYTVIGNDASSKEFKDLYPMTDFTTSTPYHKVFGWLPAR